MEQFICKYCSKICKNKNSLAQHEIRCKNNPNRKLSVFVLNNPSKMGTWNKGLTKDTDSRVAKGSQAIVDYYKTHDGVWKGKKLPEATRKKMSESAKNREIGGYRSRKHCIIYRGIYLDSSYELILAEDLDLNKVEWTRCKKFYYKDNKNEQHTYTPDFYLPELDLYIDTKNDYLINNPNPKLGYKDTDKINWVMQQNNITIYILDKDHLSYQSILQMLA